MIRHIPPSLLTPFKNGAPGEELSYLAHLLGAWFHQDYSYEGDTLEQIIQNYRVSASDDYQRETADDIEAFLAANDETEQALAEATEAVFHPEVIIEGWDGMTTRQWLLRIAELLR